MQQYKVIKFFQNDRKAQVIRRGLTLEQAQAICNDDETSSKTKRDLQSPVKQRNLDAKQAHWFYGYEREV